MQRYFRGTKENTKFIYDGQDVLIDDNSGTLTKYINGQGIDNKLRVQTGSDVNYFLADHLGSTNGLADSSGNLTASTNYDAFGNASNANFPTRYQFTGREHDSFTGLHYYRARFYDANLGRFISEDPIGFAGGDVNLYGYVQNNPAMMRDPSGKIPPLIVGAIVVGGLILTSPSYVNAPAPGDPVYDSRSPLLANAAMGATGGYLAGRFLGWAGSKICQRFGGGFGDDIIELGISQGPENLPYPKQVGINMSNPCVTCARGNASALGLSDDLVARAGMFDNPNFVGNFPKVARNLPNGNFEPVNGHFATKYGNQIIDSALEANLRLRGHNISLGKVSFSFEEYAQLVNLLR